MFSPITSFCPASIIPPMLHTHSLIYHRRCIMFSSITSFSPASIIPPMLHTHSLIYHRRCIMFSPITSVSLVSIIPPMPHIHSIIYHRHCIMFFSQYFSFPCQYHSTNAPFSSIHLPPTLYNVFLPILQFPRSVSFHQCSILIYSSTTDTV